jgi:hypothetical protein
LYLLRGKTGEFAVGNSPQAVGGDLSGHVPILGIDDKVGIDVSELFEGIIYLRLDRVGQGKIHS